MKERSDIGKINKQLRPLYTNVHCLHFASLSMIHTALKYFSLSSLGLFTLYIYLCCLMFNEKCLTMNDCTIYYYFNFLPFNGEEA